MPLYSRYVTAIPGRSHGAGISNAWCIKRHNRFRSSADNSKQNGDYKTMHYSYKQLHCGVTYSRPLQMISRDSNQGLSVAGPPVPVCKPHIISIKVIQTTHLQQFFINLTFSSHRTKIPVLISNDLHGNNLIYDCFTTKIV